MPAEWIVLIIFLSLLALFVLFTLIASFFLAHSMSYPIRYTTEFTYDVDLKKGVINDIGLLKRTKQTWAMKDGYVIHGDVSLNPGSKKYVIIVHGYAWNKEGSLKYGIDFYKLGYNVIIYDERGQGDNKKTAVTMGFKEKDDLHEIILWAYKTYGEDIFLGVHGESMGGAIVLLETQYQDRLQFIVSDCPYASLKELCRKLVGVYHLPPYLVSVASIWLKLMYGYRLKDIRPAETIKNNKVPLLLFHGREDRMIPYANSVEIKKANPGYCQLHIYEKADHAESLIKHQEEYLSDLKSFLDSLNNLKEEKSV